MNLHAVMIVKNEMDRYLKPVLRHLDTIVDKIYVFDDESDDGLWQWLPESGLKCVWGTRSRNVPSFMEDESALRQSAYAMVEGVGLIQGGDWVLSVDADEMIVEDYPGQLKEVLASSSMSKHSLRVAEVFDIEDGVPMIRTDGFWGGITQDRLFRWTGDYTMNDRPMACGSVPKWALNAPLLSGPSILHYGYAREEDRVKKYARYFGVPGHNTKHVDSIRRKPTLMPWDGPVLEGVT